MPPLDTRFVLSTRVIEIIQSFDDPSINALLSNPAKLSLSSHARVFTLLEEDAEKIAGFLDWIIPGIANPDVRREAIAAQNRLRGNTKTLPLVTP